jgi:hypothetical protein
MQPQRCALLLQVYLVEVSQQKYKRLAHLRFSPDLDVAFCPEA